MRVHFDNLLRLAQADRPLGRAVAAGSLPPEMQQLWNRMENQGAEDTARWPPRPRTDSTDNNGVQTATDRHRRGARGEVRPGEGGSRSRVGSVGRQFPPVRRAVLWVTIVVFAGVLALIRACSSYS